MARLSFLPWAGTDAMGLAAPAPLETDTSPAFSLLVSLQRAGTPPRHDCGGKALCGTCRVLVHAGREGLSPMGERERLRLEAVGAPLDGSVRLACQARASRDAKIEALLGPAEGKREAR